MDVGAEVNPLGPLSDKHLAELRGSGLSDETIRAARVYDVVGPTTAKEALNCSPTMAARQLPRMLPALAYPFFDAAGKPANRPDGKPYVVLKFDAPRHDGKGKAVKYESPHGVPLLTYFPPGSAAAVADPGTPLLITEGVKKALKAWQEGFPCLSLSGVWAWCEKESKGKGAGGTRALRPDLAAVPWRGREVFIAYDSDLATKPEVMQAEAELAAALAASGATVRAVRLPHGEGGVKVGLDDYLMARPADDLRGLMAAAVEPGDPRPSILITTEQKRVNDEAVKALAAAGSLYYRNGSLVRVTRDPQACRLVRRQAGAAVIDAVHEATLRETLADAARWEAVNARGDVVPKHPPDWSVKAVFHRRQWPGLRYLVGVIESPAMRPDGTVITEPGYDADTGLLYEPTAEFPPLPASPGLADARRAADQLLDLVRDFPFVGPEHKAAWLAALLTVFARPAVTGPCPLFLFEAAAAGSGKTLLAEAVGLISTGREPAASELSDDNEEVRKCLTAIFLAGERLVVLDNASGSFGCAALDAALTSTTWAGRVLGKSERTGELPAETVFLGTGNNLRLRGDTHRRVVPCRLEPAVERPEERTEFKYPNLKAHIAANRPALAVAALTILRAYVAAGRPPQGLGAFGSFEQWSGLVRSAVHWATGHDPCKARDCIMPESRGDASVALAVFEAWAALPGGGGKPGLTAREVLRLAAGVSHPALAEALKDWAKNGDELPDASTLGYRLRSVRGRVAGRWKLVSGGAGGHAKVASYWVEPVAGAAAGPREEEVGGRSAGDAGDAGADLPPLRVKNRSAAQREEQQPGDFAQRRAEPSPASPASPATPPPGLAELLATLAAVNPGLAASVRATAARLPPDDPEWDDLAETCRRGVAEGKAAAAARSKARV